MLLFHSSVNQKVHVNHPEYYFSGFNKSFDLVGNITHRVWSPIIFENEYRDTENFSRSYWCVLDFDDGMTLDDAINTWCDCAHIIGLSKSHQKEKNGAPPCDRFRVCIPWEYPIEKDEGDKEKWETSATYRHNITFMVDKYNADPQCKDGARYYFPCTEIVSRETDGYCIDVLKAPPTPPQQIVIVDSSRIISREVSGWLEYGCPKNEANTTCYKIGAELGKVGFTINEIVSLIMQSPVPVISPTKDVSIEVRKAVTNGVNKYNVPKNVI